MKPKHIVLAEDEHRARIALSIILRKAGYQVTAAADGKKALDILLKMHRDEQPADLLVSDIQMPELNGLQLIDELRKNKIDIPILVITGFGDKETVIQLMRKGCDDFIEKPFEPDEVLNNAAAVLKRNESLQREKKKELEQMERKTSRMTREMETFKKNYLHLSRQFDSAVDAYQDIIHIDVTASHVKMAYRFQPLSRLGGDFFDACRTEKGCAILVADVAGHDMGASYHAVLLKAFFNESCTQGKPGQELFYLLNQQLIKNKKVERMVTAMFLEINLEQMVLETVSAGHPPMLKINGNGNGQVDPAYLHTDEKGGHVLGIFENTQYQNCRFPIKAGDRFVLYTDGVIDALRVNGPSGKKTKLLQEGLMEIIQRHRQKELNQLIDTAWNDVFEFCRHKPHDDMLLLGVEIP
ncbi:MAG: SpoIIE family protein phosphatase [Candidatus Aminicenantes bacterium]|nr:MAG: SpoIIE family protein phosphatase [Candidatus Aminicenantes bacterium]